MAERKVGVLDWRLPAGAIIGGCLLFSIFLVPGADDVFSYWPVVFFLGSVLLIGAVSSQKRRRSFLLALLVFATIAFATSQIPFVDRIEARNSVRWFLWAKRFKAEILAQPDQPDKGWKHLEWDGWGFAGAGDTSIYVVYNPSNVLEEPARTQFAGAVLTPTPRGVMHVQRLEKDWYSVIFPADEKWERD